MARIRVSYEVRAQTSVMKERFGRRVIDDKKVSPVRKCLLCGHKDISATGEGRFVTTSCSQCGAVLKIEFNPPDEPEVRARIERIDDAR
jgi:uncharacterized Zn finger protein